MSEGRKLIVSNRRARFDYHLEDRFEAGIVLTGTEIKALRAGKASLVDAFVFVGREGADLVNLYIGPYENAGYASHEPKRRRRLLLHRRELDKLRKGTERQGFTVVPTQMHLSNGRAKVEIALGKGKQNHDKRDSVAERDAKRAIDRAKKDRS